LKGPRIGFEQIDGRAREEIAEGKTDQHQLDVSTLTAGKMMSLGGGGTCSQRRLTKKQKEGGRARKEEGSARGKTIPLGEEKGRKGIYITIERRKLGKGRKKRISIFGGGKKLVLFAEDTLPMKKKKKGGTNYGNKDK